MDPYGPVTDPGFPLPGYRVTAYWYAAHRGLPVDLCYLQELGLRAARTARWLGLEQAAVPEGPFLVHTWPGEIWAQAEGQLAGEFARYEHAYWTMPEPQGEQAWLEVCGGAPPALADFAESLASAREGNRRRNLPRTRVVHCQREPYDVYIGRPGPWGNPFIIGPDGTREQVIAAYEAYARSRPGLMAAVPRLRGKVLGCWCAPAPCHGDVLARLADESMAAGVARGDGYGQGGLRRDGPGLAC